MTTTSKLLETGAPIPMGATLLFGLLAAPLAWFAQWLLSYAVASFQCAAPNGAPANRHLALTWPFLLFAVLALLMASAAIVAARRSWRCWRESANEGAKGSRRNRFLAYCALLNSGVFGVAILFNIAALSVATLCGS